MIPKDVYLIPILNNAPRLLGLLNRNISSSSYGCFDREYWHYNTADFSCARKQEAVLTLTLLYLIDSEKNRYYQSSEMLNYIRSALLYWSRIQNSNGSFNEWYPGENSFVATSFSTYAVSESLLLIRDNLTGSELEAVTRSLIKSGDWLMSRNETRVMNQQTGAVTALLNLHLLTNKKKYLDSSREKVALLIKRQSQEGWFLEYGGPDIGYLSLSIDYLCKYYSKTKDDSVKEIISRSLDFIKYFVQPDLIAGGEYASRNTEYLIPHGFEIFSKVSEEALFVASAVRKSLLSAESFPHLFDDRYLTYVGYTWLQSYLDANPEIDERIDQKINAHFEKPFRKYFKEAGLLILNDDKKHLVINMKKGGSFRMCDKKTGRAYSDSGILIRSNNKWVTSGWLSDVQSDIKDDTVSLSGKMWKVPDKTLTPVKSMLLRLFQLTVGRSSFVSLWLKERLRDILITDTKPSSIRYSRKMSFSENSRYLLKVRDSGAGRKELISSISVFTKDTHIYVPSSRYYVDMKGPAFQRDFIAPVKSVEIEWKISGDAGVEFTAD